MPASTPDAPIAAEPAAGAAAEPRPEEFDRFKKVLYEIFQFDVADLDFGIYRILNEKREAVDRFIREDLHRAVKEGISTYVEGQTEDLQQQVKQKREELKETGKKLGQEVVTDDGEIVGAFEGSELGEELQRLEEELEAAEMADTTERRVYDDLARFFRRYYEEGDFITQRRFRSGRSTYVVPYDGEEVLLHWANRDQYYVKTSEHFKNYRFEARDYDVEFRLVDAESPNDNVKENEARYFVLHGDDPVSVDAEAKTCTITMAYRTIADDEKEAIVDRYNEETGESKSRLQRRMLCTALEARILEDVDAPTLKALLAQPKEEGDDRGRLYTHLNRYTAANTADYFVHRDLEGFLSGQLAYFIQNEVLDLDDVLAAGDETVTQQAVNRAKVVKSVGEKVIAFLAQIENFQKRLFEKKKFVVDTGYCVTLDRVPDALYDAILENDEQLDEWRDLYAVDQWENGLFSQGYEDGTFTRDFLEAHPHVMIDTKHFGRDFVDTLLAHLSTLDDDGIAGVVEGLCIQGENFQALNLLQERFREQVDCQYLDPPYNTESNSILYKNKFKHSSWMSMMQDRLAQGRRLTHSKSVHVIAIDEHEQERLGLLVDNIYSGLEKTCVTIIHNPGGTQSGNFKRSNEYAYFLYPPTAGSVGGKEREDEDDWDIRPLRDVSKGDHLRKDAANCFYPILVEDGEIIGFGDVCDDDFHPDSANVKRENGTLEIYPIDAKGNERKWTFARQSVEKIKDQLSVEYNRKREILDIVRTKKIFNPKTTWTHKKYNSNTYGSKLLNSILGESRFDFPKSIHNVKDCITVATRNDPSALILDFFAGSATTGHAVIELNRDDNVDGDGRQYILVEMGEHFDTVMLPRLKKVAFSSKWKEGVPQGNDGMSHVIQYHRLESYEDALNNIQVEAPTAVQKQIFKAWGDYEMRYMLEEETKDSGTFLRPDAFEKPFDYTLRIQHGMESPKRHAVDLEATFNFLIGLQVETRTVHRHEKDGNRRYVIVTGTVETENAVNDVMVIWRDREGLDDDALRREKAWVEAEVIGDRTFDTVYVNGKSYVHGAEPLEITFRVRMDPAA